MNARVLWDIGPVHTETGFPAFSRGSRTTSSLLETIQKRRKTFPCASDHSVSSIDRRPKGQRPEWLSIYMRGILYPIGHERLLSNRLRI